MELSANGSHAREILELIAKATHDVIWDWNLETGEVWWNDNFKTVFGYQESEIGPGHTSREEHIHPADRERVLNSIYGAIENGLENWSARYRFRRKDGSYAYIYDRGYTIHQNGKAVRMTGAMHDVTKRVLLKRKRAEREKRMQLALDSTGLGTWVLDPATNIVKTDERARELFGITESDVFEFEGSELYVHEDDRERVLDAIQQTMDPLIQAEYDVTYRTINTKSVKIRWLHCLGRAYFNKEGIAYRFAGTVADITEEKRKEAALKYAETRYQAAFDNALLGITITDLQGYFISVNDAYCKITGYSAYELYKMNFTAIAYPDDIPANERLLKKLQQDPVSSFDVTQRCIRKGGEIIWIRMSLSSVKDETGRPESLIFVCQNITAEVDTKEEQQRLLQQMEVLTNVMPQMVWVASSEGERIFFNQRWYDYTGMNFEQSRGSGWRTAVHTEDRDPVLKAWTTSLITGQQYEMEYRLKSASGEYRWYLTRALPLYNEHGNIQEWMGTSTDINDYKELQRQKDEFLGIASHELKTPVTSIKGYAQYLVRMFHRKGASREAEFLNKLDMQVDRMSHLIGDLLDVTKINSGKLQFREDFVDLNFIVREVAEELRHLSHGHKIIMDINSPKFMYCDKYRIGQVVTNLLTNAIKYSPDADSILIKTWSDEENVFFSVRDYGIGIASENKERIFEQFYRVNYQKQYNFSGLGLGLYISSEIIKRSGGKIWVESAGNTGSLFCFSIPFDHREHTRV